MIASLKGRIADQIQDSIILEVGGVGLQVFIPTQLLGDVRVGELIHLYTYLAVREDSLTLYGFSSIEERDFFNMLLGVNGVGPRLALAGLSTLNPDTIRRAVFSEQPEIFSRIPGVGKKTAQKIIFHLQDKLDSIKGFRQAVEMDDTSSQVLEALVALGYSIVEAQAAIQSIPRGTVDDIETKIRLALQYFSN
jgi:Holliday junction DNA helicase RuvA